MAAALAQRSNSGWGKRKIPADKLRSELAAAWQHSAETDRARHNEFATRVRMTLSSLIVAIDLDNYAHAESAVSQLIGNLCAEYPSRFIIVGYSSDSLMDLSVEVSSQCVLTHNGPHVCSEEIYLSLGRSGIAAVPNIVRSILAPDVPIELLLLTHGASSVGFNQLIEKLVPLSDRASFDSNAWPNGRFGESWVLEELHNKGAKSTLRDLVWRRIRSWRRLIIEQFDLSACVDPLAAMQAVKIVGASAAEKDEAFIPNSDTLMLGAWISNKLQWSLVSVEKQSAAWVFRGKNGFGRESQLSLCPDDLDCETDTSQVKNVQSVSFSAEHGQGAMLEVNLKFLPSEQVAQVTMQRVQNGKLPFCDWTARRVSFSLPTLSELVLAELSAGVKCHELETTEMQLGKISLLAS